jgi:hypothetical protein
MREVGPISPDAPAFPHAATALAPLKAAARSEPAPGFRLVSVNSSSLLGCGPQSEAHSSFSAMVTEPEKATKVR